MSFNRLKYDTCTYKQELKRDVTTLDYLLSTFPFENCNKCRHEFGLVGGTNVSHTSGNMVDVESELRGQTRVQSRCPCNKYQGPDDRGMIVNHQTAPLPIDATAHLPSCQMISYRAIPLPPKMNVDRCARPTYDAVRK